MGKISESYSIDRLQAGYFCLFLWEKLLKATLSIDYKLDIVAYFLGKISEGYSIDRLQAEYFCLFLGKISESYSIDRLQAGYFCLFCGKNF